ncbi:MAG TPA: hypothetical protein VF006_28540 [Longimicrobium sp.]
MPFIPDTAQSALPFRRRGTIRISESWPTPLLVAPGLLDLVETPQWVSFPHLFAHIADRTAPPTGYGFSLAETWALARYLGAVAGAADFSLSRPWDDLDSHQKTILSDDWGVGMASLVATAAFQPSAIANTGEWLRRSGGVASANRAPRKRGPAKSPDFVFEDAQGRFHLVEAKGTQGSLKGLMGQLEDGRDQKENITFHDRSVEGVRLVVGTRVPLEGGGRIEVVVADPPLDVELPTDRDRARAWLRRVGLAGACRAAGLPTWATALVSLDGFGGLRGEAARELRVRSLRGDGEDLAGRETVVILPRPLEGRGRDWRLVLGMPGGLLHELLDSPDLDMTMADLPVGAESDSVQREIGASGTVSAVTPNALHFRMHEL